MSTIINATTTNGVVIQPDNSGSLVLQTNNGTTALTIDTSQRAAFVAGTAVAPAITTAGDTNTGMFFPAADTIAFAEGGVEAMRLDSAGNVGIGTTSPNGKLELSGTGPVIFRLNDTVTNYWQLESNSYLAFNRGGTERMRIDSSGRVTKPFQTAFLAQAVQSDTTYSGGGTLIPFPNEVFDIGNNYDASTSRFTAPVTGIYLVSWTCWNNSATTSRSALYKNGSIYKSSVNLDAISTRHNAGGDQANGVTIPVQLSVGDYIEVKVYGNAITQFWMNYFSAYLLG